MGLMDVSNLRAWNRRAGEANPRILRRLGRVHSIRRPQAGEIGIAGLTMFFTPTAVRFQTGHDENVRVKALLGECSLSRVG